MRIRGNTRIYPVIADPVFQLRTPELLNPIWAQAGINTIAMPYHVAADDLPAAWETFRAIQNLAGIGIAMPHKENAASLCDRLDPSAQCVGVVGAVRREPNGTLFGAALEGAAFMDALNRQGHSVAGKSVLLVGAGGAATAIAYELLDSGVAQLVVANRNADRAKELVAKLNASGKAIAEFGEPDPRNTEVLINATSLGLRSDDPLPLDTRGLSPRHLVVDIIAQPEVTALLETAKMLGCRVHSGLHMITSHMELVAKFIAQHDSAPSRRL